MISSEAIVRQFIAGNKGKIFSIEFLKKDGSVRKMVCRTGVKKYLKHPDAHQGTYKPSGNVLTVFDMRGLEYRSFTVSNLLNIRMRGMPVVTGE